MTDEDNKELVRRHFDEIWNRRNFTACEELMATAFVEHAAAPFAQSAPGQVDGPKAMRGTVEWLLTQFPDLHMTIEHMVAEGDIVVARITSEGSNTGKLNGFFRRVGKGGVLNKATGSVFKIESSRSTGQPETTSSRCCNSV